MPDAPIVEFQHITKRFPGIVALSDVSFTIQEGSCHALVGENGAGKSTLGKILGGIHAGDGGQILLDGKPVHFSSPTAALRAGIGIVHQELAFCENMSVAENLCLENLPRVGPFYSLHKSVDRAREMLKTIGSDIDVTQTLGELTVSQQQMVQIAAAVGRGARVIVFDEPTSSLSQQEVELLFTLIRRLQSEGVTAIYVSHRMPEIFTLCDTITVLRDGRHVATRPVKGLSEDELVEMMIGRRLDQYFPTHLGATLGEERLRVEHYSSPGKFTDINFTLHAGEVLGLAGLVGAGRTELVQALFGLDPRARGHVFLSGKPVAIHTPQQAIRHGVGLVPEDRKRHGLVLSMSARENMTLPILRSLAILGWINRRRDRAIADKFFKELQVRAANSDVLAASLSGGNQQKIVLAKWLAAECPVLFLDEPTRGVDVGAKAEIHALIDELARQGTAIILVSSELPEVINLATRILVLRLGRQVAELTREEANQDILLRLMAGIKSGAAA
jgi:ABC-type sugar transport system ATPase subunit